MLKGSIYAFLLQHLDKLGDLEGKVVVDIPAGAGNMSAEFSRRGARVIALDMYPDKITTEGIQKLYADMNKPLPLEDNSADIVLCQEGIEHIHNQLDLLYECNRILKPGGLLLITTPSLSHVRARISMLLVESEYWKRMPASEVDSVWFSEDSQQQLYFGHLYLLTANHLRVLTSLSGFEILRRNRTNISTSSIVLSTIMYPFIILATLIAALDSYRKVRHIWNNEKRRIYMQQIRINISPVTLLCKDLFWVLKKTRDKKQMLDYLKGFTR